MQLLSLIDEHDKLLELINDCLKPKEIEKKLFAEVFTPIPFINDYMLYDLEMYYLTTYNINIYEDETMTYFDATTGMGNFMVAIFYKLMEGLKTKIVDKEDRKKHIIENMLYMAELNKKNCFVVKQIFNIDDKYKLNLYQGNSLTIDIEKEFGIKKFDIIIGNPPYNEELKSTGATALYNKFVEYYIDKCRILSFVIPSRWFSGGKGLDKFRNMMLNRNDLVYIKHFDDASKIFGNSISISGGIHYFLKDVTYNGDCLFNGSKTKLNKYDVFIDGKYHPIIDKIMKSHNSITTIYLGRYFGIETNDKRLLIKEKKTTIKCYVSQQKGFEKFIEKTEINKEYNFWKLITTRANGGANSGFGNMFIGNPQEIHTGSYISFRTNNEMEAKSLLSYMKCRLPNFMLLLRKNSQDINLSTCEWIPLPPLDRIWNNEEIYKYFKLTQTDIQLINETKLVGYKEII